MQGRVMSLVASAATAMSPLSLLVAGPVSDWIGIRTWYLTGGVLSLFIGIAGFFIPALINIEKNHNGHAVESTKTIPTPEQI